MRQSDSEIDKNPSFLNSHNFEFLETLQKRFQEDPTNIDSSWQKYFESIQKDPQSEQKETSPSWHRTDWPPIPLSESMPPTEQSSFHELKEKISKKATEHGLTIDEQQLKQAVLDSFVL